MDTISDEFENATRLSTIAERIGFALWQLQELESSAAQYYVLIAKASPGMGTEAGQELLDEALSRTFGKTVTRLEKSGKVPTDLMRRLQVLLDERNWLVHNSRASSRSAVRDETVCADLIQRVDAIANEALNLLKEVSEDVKTFILGQGFSPQQIKLAEQRALKQL